MSNDAVSWRIEPANGETHAFLEGDITEVFNGKAQLPKLKSRVVLNLERVRRINSMGVRAWIEFLAALSAQGTEFVLERCSPATVSQLNMVRSFAGKGTVRSVMAPFFCNLCRIVHLEPLAADHTAWAQISKTIPCEKCKMPMEFDDLPEAYLTFTKQHDSANVR